MSADLKLTQETMKCETNLAAQSIRCWIRPSTLLSDLSCHVDSDKKSQDFTWWHGETPKSFQPATRATVSPMPPGTLRGFVASISIDVSNSESLSARAMCIAMTGMTRKKGRHLPKDHFKISCYKVVSKHMFQADSYYHIKLILIQNLQSPWIQYRMASHHILPRGSPASPTREKSSARLNCYLQKII